MGLRNTENADRTPWVSGAGRLLLDVCAQVCAAHLLHNLVAKSKSEYAWTEQHSDQFEDLKKVLTSAPVLATMDP